MESIWRLKCNCTIIQIVFYCTKPLKIFTARCYASTVYVVVVYLSVRPSVCPSVLSRCSTKTANPRMTQITPYDCPGTLVFWSQKSRRNSKGFTPRLSQPQIQPTNQCWQDQGNGEKRHSVPHTHSKWSTEASRYVALAWVPYYRRWLVYDGIPYQVKQGQAIVASLQKIWKSHSIPIFIKIRLRMKALVWPVAMYGCESWTLRKNEKNTSWRLWDERAEKDSAGFVDSKENKWVGS